MHRITTPVARWALAQQGEGMPKKKRRRRRSPQRAPRPVPEQSTAERRDVVAAFERWRSSTMTEAQIAAGADRSEEHTSELQSRGHLVCRLLLEKKKQ